MSTTVTSKGQVTIPKPVRDRLNIKPGSQVDFELAEDGRIVLVKAGKKLAAPAKGRFDRLRGIHEKRHDDGRDHGADARRSRRGMILVDTNVLLDVVTDDPALGGLVTAAAQCRNATRPVGDQSHGLCRVLQPLHTD